jgi:hypothetical protein
LITTISSMGLPLSSPCAQPWSHPGDCAIPSAVAAGPVGFGTAFHANASGPSARGPIGVFRIRRKR